MLPERDIHDENKQLSDWIPTETLNSKDTEDSGIDHLRKHPLEEIQGMLLFS